MIDRLADLKKEIEPSLVKASRKGSYLVAIFHLEQNQINLNWHSSLFPVDDFDAAVDLLDQELRVEKKRALDPFCKTVVKEPTHG